MNIIITLLAVGAGSFAGGIARYGINRLFTGAGCDLWWATLTANLIGCFLLGLFYGLFERLDILSPNMRLMLTVGFCGGFTTFSTFVNENYTALCDGRLIFSIIYAAGSFALGLLMIHLGHRLTC